jgi:hypothetical protein
MIKDYYQYRMNITLANLNPHKNPSWEEVYKASDLFEIDDLSQVEKINSFVKNLLNNETSYLKMCKAFFTEGPQISYCYDRKNGIL